ncbi:MAG: hypothetical protein ACI3VB_01830 [Oscillospiraceae bacterium]
MKEDRYIENENNHSKVGRRGHSRGGLTPEPGTHLLFIGSHSCARHSGNRRVMLQQQGQLSYLCVQDIEWITGDYLRVINEAAREVVKMYKPEKLRLFGGCQLELVNLDFDMLTKELTEELKIPVEFQRGCHLIEPEGED